MRWISYYPPHHTLCLDGYRESALAFMFDKMTLSGIEFDPASTFVGDEPTGPAGAIIISGHFHLNNLYLRLVHDRGKRVNLLMESPPIVPRVVGTRSPLGIIRPDTMSLVRIRRRVAAGEIVGALVDTTEEREGRPAITTPHGTVFISDEIMRLAERAGLPILFGTTRVAASGKIVMKLIRPSSTRADAVLEEFCQFLRAEIAQVAY